MRRIPTALLLLAVIAPLASSGAQMAYRQPPAAIAKILDTPPTPAASFSPDRSKMLMTERNGLPPISDVGAPYLRLAGTRVNPRTNGSWRETFARGLVVRAVEGTTETRIATTAGAKISHVMWSDDSKKIVFSVTGNDGIKMWVADAATGAAHKLTDIAMDGIATPCSWMDATELICQTIPAGRGVAPAAPEIPEGPIVQEADGRKNPAPTFEDLLSSPQDEKLYDYYFTSQLAIVSLDGTVTKIGAKGIHSRVSPSPDGKFVLVSTVHRPYSYQVPEARFPAATEVWDRTGKVVRKVQETSLQESAPRGQDAVEVGPRSVGWRSDAPASLVWVEALDGGDMTTPSPKHDHVLMLSAPFSGQPAELIAVDSRIGGGRGGSAVVWAKPDLAIVSEASRKTRKSRTWAINPSNPSQAPRLMWEHSTDDRYNDPGRFELARGPFGDNVLLTSKDGKSAYLTGLGSSPEGDRPFLNRYDLATGKTTQLFRSEAPYYEAPVTVLDPDGNRIVTLRESTDEVPNYFIRDVAANKLTQLTHAKDPAPEFAGVHKEFVKYKRADGVDLTATVYLPAGYDKAKDGPLPFFLWAYPAEFETVAAASQVSGSPYRFTRPSGASRLMMLTQGYGVMDNPTIPIIAQNGGKPNDTYVEQLVAGAKAAIDKVVEMGVADRDRIAVGGHSYGAFMTANLLAHTNFFRAGIAESGAYMRTLTPFGFQNEERSYWEATDLYTKMSPFTYADSIKTPILLIHGMADDNTGTFPINSERLFAALKGNGGTAKYVQLPAEPHGYRARESIGHVLAEEVEWLNKFVKPKVKVKAVNRMKWVLGAAALLLQGCATRGPARGAVTDDSLLQRMLVAEDSRGKDAEGILPLLEGERSADTTLRRVALRGLDRVNGYKPMATAPAARPPREAPKPCASLVPPTRDPNPRAMLAAIDALGGPCTDDGTARADLLRTIAATLDARDLPRAAGHVSWHAAAHAIVALARVPGGDRPAAELLPRFLAHPRPQVRAYAARAAAALKNEAVLLRLTSDPDHNVAEAAILGLSQLKKHAYDSVYIAALASRGYQVVLTTTNALAGSPSAAAIPALLSALDRLTVERRENARDERIAILARVAELGAAPDAPRIRPYLTDFDTTIAGRAAAILTKWTGTTVTAHANPLPIRLEPLAEIFRTRGMQLRITMAESSGGGTILVRLFTDNAPATIARIVRLARAHYYDGLTFHRIVPGFVIQGGSPDANEQVGDAAFMRDELGGPSHTRGTLGISTRGHDTGDAQIFVNLVDNLRLDHDYTVFGEVVSGMDVVDGILEGDVMARWEIIGGTIPK